MPDVVTVGCRVRVRYEEDGFEKEYEVVLPGKENPANGRISPNAPIGKAIIGGREGEVRRYGTIHGEIEIRILKIV